MLIHIGCPLRTTEAEELRKIGVYGTEAATAKAPMLRDFAEAVFLPWVKNNQQLEAKTKVYYNSGWRLLKETPLAGKRMDQITPSDCDVTPSPIPTTTQTAQFVH